MIYPVMLWANCGGDPAEFDQESQMALCEDLDALGYKRHQRPRDPMTGHFMFVWRRDGWPSDEVFGPMPYFGPAIERDEDWTGDDREPAEVLVEFSRHLDELFPDD